MALILALISFLAPQAACLMALSEVTTYCRRMAASLLCLLVRVERRQWARGRRYVHTHVHTVHVKKNFRVRVCVSECVRVCVCVCVCVCVYVCVYSRREGGGSEVRFLSWRSYPSSLAPCINGLLWVAIPLPLIFEQYGHVHVCTCIYTFPFLPSFPPSLPPHLLCHHH